MENIAQGFSFLDPTIIYSWSMEDLIIYYLLNYV
jgi:hypothetical protein